MTVGDVIAAGFLPTGERHPVIRWGSRDEIPLHVRVAVMYRDQFRCQLCPSGSPTPEVIELDHIKPWSAGGADTSDNLRVLCQGHNQERGNKVIPEERPAVPVTWWCHRCFMLDEHLWDYDSGPVPHCPKHYPWNGLSDISRIQCRVQRPYARAVIKGEQPIDWHRRQGIEAATLTAYCAHCNLRGLTDVTL